MNGKKKQIRRSFAFIMAVIMVLSTCFTDFRLFGGWTEPAAPKKAEAKTVKGAKITNPDAVLTENDVESKLLAYFCKIMDKDSNGKVTVREARAYTESITVPEGAGLRGIYYADNASSFDITQVKETKIPDGTFTDCKGATSVTMSDDVTVIGDSAFSGCEKLAEINLKNVTSVGESAFNGCTALTQSTYDKLVNNKTLEKLGTSAFAGCTSLTTLTVPKISSYENLGSGVFSGCKGAEVIDFKDAAIPRIPAAIFQNCGTISIETILESKTVQVQTNGTAGFPTQIDSVGNDAFSGCALAEVDLSGCTKLTTIGNRSFQFARLITDITFPDTLTSIGEMAFQGACNEADVIIPGNVTKLGQNVFQASYISKVTFACNNLEEIPSLAFNNTRTLKKVVFTEPANSKLKIISTDAFSNTGLNDLDFLPELTKLEEIGDYAFSMCYDIDDVETKDNYGILTGTLTGITDISIPDCVQKLGKGAFSDNHSLKTVEIGNGVKEIPEECFAAVTDKQGDSWKDSAPVSLQKVILPSTLTSIGKSAFQGNYKLMTMSYKTGAVQDEVITFPETLESIGEDAFRQCSFFEEYEGEWIHFGMTDIILPDNVTALGDGAFSRCTNLNTVVLPKNLEVIPNNLFIGCGIDKSDIKSEQLAAQGHIGLKSVTFPEKLTTIGANAFDSCYAFDLKNEGALPSTLTEIKNNAFYQCKSLTKVEFPNALETIGDYAFAECSETEDRVYTVQTDSGFTTETVKMVKSGLSVINMRYATNLISIGNYAFANAAIESFSLGAANKLEKIGASAFDSCTNLTQVNLFDNDGNSSLKSFGTDCFSDCVALNNIRIPYSAKLNRYMFSGMCGGENPTTQINVVALAGNAADKEVQVPLNGEQALPVAFFDEDMLAGNLDILDKAKVNLQKEGGNGIVSASYDSPDILLKGLKEDACVVNVSASLEFEHAGRTFFKAFTYEGNVSVKPVPCSELYFSATNMVTTAAGEKIKYIRYQDPDPQPYIIRAFFGPANTSDKPKITLSVANTVTMEEKGLVESTSEGELPHYEYGFYPKECGETTFTCTMGSKKESIIIKTVCPGNIRASATSVKITSGIEKTYNLSDLISLTYADEYAELSKNHPDSVIYKMSDPSPYMTIDEATGVVTTTQEVTETEYVYITATSAASGQNVSITIQLVPKLTDFEISEASVGLKVGETKEISVKNDETLKPSMASRRVTWKTSNSKVVSLSSTDGVADKGTGITDSNVVLKGVSDGTVTITATSLNGIVKKCPVKVSKDGAAPPVPTDNPGGSGGGNGGGGGGTGGKKAINVRSIALKTTYPSKVIYLKKGKGYRINSVVTPANTTNRLVWTSSNTSKVKVSGGYVQGVAPGNANVTLTAYNGSSVVKRASIKVVVLKKAVKAKSVKIKGKKKLKVGRSVQLKAVVKPKKCTATIKWTSKTKKIASVDKYGVVTGKKKGTAKIVAKAQPGKKSKVFKIKVTK